MSCLPIVKVYNGLGNTDGVVFGLVNGASSSLFPFTGVTRMTLGFDVAGVATLIDSALAPTAITWGAATGEVTFALGAQSIPAGTYAAKLVIYSPTYPTGYLMDVDGLGNSLTMKVT